VPEGRDLSQGVAGTEIGNVLAVAPTSGWPS
jgi:hypothetical protein